ncbi:Ig kappa chain V region K16-167 [Oryzias melastigma]|uniref:Ig kappa chain V region K16-167 n=1 Tax=Oryzias melastigma TaxID=30732 RepID=A0A834C342_ORYME|nr:Ig kappa chain V region K16-167 [Oryzias melastigma]
MLSVQTSVFTLLLLVIGTDVSCEELTAVKKEESTLEGASVTLSYKYPKLATSNFFFWYRQFPGKPPEFLVSHSSSGVISMTKMEGLKIQVKNKQIDLQISSPAVTDSAVYYCAVTPTVTGNNKTLYKNQQRIHNTTQHPLDGAKHCESTDY